MTSDRIRALADHLFFMLPEAHAHSWRARLDAALEGCPAPSLAWPRFALALLIDADYGARQLAPADELLYRVERLLLRAAAGETVAASEWTMRRVYDASHESDLPTVAIVAASVPVAIAAATIADTPMLAIDALRAHSQAWSRSGPLAIRSESARARATAWQADTLLGICKRPRDHVFDERSES